MDNRLTPEQRDAKYATKTVLTADIIAEECVRMRHEISNQSQDKVDASMGQCNFKDRE